MGNGLAMNVSSTEWIIFGVIVLVLLSLDLYLAHRHPGKISVKSALIQTAMWISVALVFGVWVYMQHGADAAGSYYAAYVIEKAMSVDNLFVFILLFSMFSIPEEYQHKALFYGVFGAIVFRAIFVIAGSALLEKIDFMMYVFGILLVFLAFKTAFGHERGDSKTAKWVSKHFKVSPELDGNRFFTKSNGVRMMTPLFACVIAIELTDLIFAIDSVPACLAITSDVFIVYTSNIFAVLGLRSLYFAIHGSLESLRYMKYGLAGILIFVGVKMLISNFYHINVGVSLAVILGLLAVTITASLLIKPKKQVS